MKKVLFILFAMTISMFAFAQTTTVELVNQQFEDGDAGQATVPGWKFQNEASGSWYCVSYSDGNTPDGLIGMVGTVSPAVGEKCLAHKYYTSHSNSWAILEQDIVVPADAESAMLSFQWAVRYPQDYTSPAGVYLGISQAGTDITDFQKYVIHSNIPGQPLPTEFEWQTEVIDLSNHEGNDYRGKTIHIAFIYDATNAGEFTIDNVVSTAEVPKDPTGGTSCHLECPGDMNITLAPGECEWLAKYDVRTEGCTPAYIGIQTPDAIEGFTGVFDPSDFPDIANQGLSEAGTVNGPAGAGTNFLDFKDLPHSITMHGYSDPGEECPGPIPTGDNYSTTMINFIAPFAGRVTFDWTYHTDDTRGPFYDEFVYLYQGASQHIYDPSGNREQNGTFSIDIQEGESIAFGVFVSLFDIWGGGSSYCAANVNISNFSFVSTEPLNGIYHVSGPKLGEPVRGGETKTVELALYQNNVKIDGCDFEVAVKGYTGATQTLACNDLVQVSVDENCEAYIGSDMILEGGPYGCYDEYEVKIFKRMPTNFANAVPDVSNPAPLGNYWVGIYDKKGNNCWGQIVVLDKLPPVVECDTVAVSCKDAEDFLKPVVTDGCDADPSLELADVTKVKQYCQDTTEIITRRWVARDSSGNMSECTQVVYVTRTDVYVIDFPENWDGLTQSPYNHNPMLLCDDDGYPLDSLGNPHPDTTGWPNSHDTNCGTLEMYYNDVVYTKEDDPELCGEKILRYWTVVDDCRGVTHEDIQIIRITDETAPTFSVVVADTVVVSTGAYKCSADYEVPGLVNLKDECGNGADYRVTSEAGYVEKDKKGNWIITDLPQGVTKVCYDVYDSCENDTTACFYVSVEDLVPPIPVCEQFKQVSLTVEGTAVVCAEDFDSGSIDNCNDISFKVKRVDELGGLFHDCVDFDCEDVGNSIMVTLRVYDSILEKGDVSASAHLGHYNDCMSNVEIACKLPPVITSCEDVTIPVDCEELNNLTDLEKYLVEPTVEAVCIESIEHGDVVVGGDICNPTMSVTWTVKSCGKTATCTQNINLESDTHFDPCTIEMPADVTVKCRKEISGGEPTWESSLCDMVTSEIINEDTFKFVDNACYKIVREWAVIDWCVYEPNTGAEEDLDVWNGDRTLNCEDSHYTKPDTFDGYYRYTQILMMIDEEAPVVEVSDSCIGVYDGCSVYPVSLTARATDECNLTDRYDWKYRILEADTWEVVQYSRHYSADPDKDDKVGESDNLRRTNSPVINLNNALEIGVYKVEWTVGDGCGNLGKKVQTLRVADKKAPTPIMVDIATAVMQNGEVDLSARTFDKGGCGNGCISSFDNCTKKEGLYFTFDNHLPHLWEGTWKLDANGLYYFDPHTGARKTRQDFESYKADAWDPEGRTAIRRYYCEQFGEGNAQINQDVYVWDQFAENDDCDDNNYDFATVVLSFNNCAGSITHALKGKARLVETNEGVENIKMTTMVDSEVMGYSTTDANGGFEFNLNPGSYTVYGSSDEDVLNGVSTIDIVLIQKHILGIGSGFTASHDLLAADANNDGRVTAADIAVIRKVILSIRDNFKNNSWVAISEESGERDLTVTVDGDVTADFTVVKIGDLNNSAGSVIESRSGDIVNFELDNAVLEAGEVVEVPVYANNFSDVRGGQFAISMSNVNVEGVKAGKLNIETSNYNVKDNNLLVSWSEVEGQSVADGEVLFTLVLKSTSEVSLRSALSMNDSQLRSEAYKGNDLEISTLGLNYRDASYSLYQNTPNPFVSETTIGFDLPEASEYTLTVYDVTGKLVKVIRAEGEAGYNAQTISKKDLNVSGVLYYRLESGDYTATKKMVILK